MKPTGVDAFLRSSKQLARLADHAARLAELQRIYARVAPVNLASCSQVANLKLGRIVILATNGGVAAKIRQLIPTLVREFSKSGAEVTGVEVRVQVAVHNEYPVAAPKPKALGSETKREICALAERLPAESPLRQALERLVRRSL